MTTVLEALTGSNTKGPEQAREIYAKTIADWVKGEDIIEEGRSGINISERINKQGDDYAENLEDAFGTKNPFLAAAAAGYKCGGEEYTPGSSHSIKAVDDMISKAVVDSSTVQAASPVAVDPMIVDIQRSRAPVLGRITTEAQAGFTAQYNVISDRSDPLGMLSESDAVDLSDNADSDFTLQTESKDMKIFADKVNISDFAQRAESTLGYMDLENTTLGQRVIAWSLFKAKQIFYGDPSVAAADGSVEDSNAYEGLAKIATDASNTIDKSTVSSGLLEDLKSELTTTVENTGLTYDSAEFLVSSDFFDALENEANASVRIDSFDQSVNFGGRQLSIKGVPVTECPNIRNYSGLSGTNFTSDDGDVFLIDRNAVRFRALAPLSTVPLGRVGLADRAAMFEYGSLIDKSQGNHTLYLSGYGI